jgi:hypothetical protein
MFGVNREIQSTVRVKGVRDSSDKGKECGQHVVTYLLCDGIEDLVGSGLQVEQRSAEVAVAGGVGRPAPVPVLRHPQHISLRLCLCLCLSAGGERGSYAWAKNFFRGMSDCFMGYPRK